MTRMAWASGTAMVCALSIGLAAQTAGSSQPPSSDQSRSSGSPITVIGCLQSPTGTAGTAGTAAGGSTGTSGSASSSSSSFILTNAKIGSGSSASGTAAAGAGATGGAATGGATSGTSGAGSMKGNTYRLSGDSSELRSHVGEQVEITGTLSSRSGASGGAAAGGAATGGAATGGAATGAAGGMSAQDIANAPELRVTSVKKIAATCPSN